MVNLLVGLPVMLDVTGPDISAITSTVSSLITALTGWMTSLTAWILADPLAVTFFAIMFIMLAIHVINSLVHKFS